MLETESRRTNGQFAAGNSGGPGRPPRQVEDDYLRTLTEVASSDAWKRICERAVKDAEAGDARARQWLSEYLLGKPSQQVTLSRPEPDHRSTEERMDAVLARISYELEAAERKVETAALPSPPS